MSQQLARALISGRGEASGVAIARALLDRYRLLAPEERTAFFRYLSETMQPDARRRGRGIAGLSGRSRQRRRWRKLRSAVEGKRQELFRRLNLAPGRHGADRGHAQRPAERTAAARPEPRRRRRATCAICFSPGSTAASWCCAASTGRRRPRSWKRSSPTRPCTRSAAGTTCAAASIRWTGAALPSSIPR